MPACAKGTHSACNGQILKRNAKGEMCKRGFIEAKRKGSLDTRFRGPVEQVNPFGMEGSLHGASQSIRCICCKAVCKRLLCTCR